MQNAPNSSTSELAARLGRSVSAVERAIRKLRVDGRLVRIGPAKGGHWKVVK
ncbi:MAG: winged helix-turn-helix transcriptional regulator [Burkholderiales bacterium]|nr:winged helix-turn-helix transcriptional regulator [Burkholderiales bacterium]